MPDQIPSNQNVSMTFDLEHKTFVIQVDSSGVLELYVDNCLRKRDATLDPTAYVWTNIELHWEEHRYIEARFSRTSGLLHVTVNGETVHQKTIVAATDVTNQ